MEAARSPEANHIEGFQMIDSYISVEQEKKERQYLDGVKEKSTNQPFPPTEKYSGGWLDGLIR